MDYGRAELADRLAADYVSGTLRGGARRRFEALLPAHPGLRGAVRDWQDRLAPLTASIAPVAPPESVWLRIQARLGFGAEAAAAPRRWWDALLLWQGATAAAVAALLAVAVFVGGPGVPSAPLIVVLEPAPGASADAAAGLVRTAFVASIGADGRGLATRPMGAVAVGADRALELWALPAEGDARSLGLISGERTTVLQRDRLPPDTRGLAVSLEPSGGSPTGKATGPVLYVGKLES